VIDLASESLADGVRRITASKGVDIVIESIGGTVTSEALSSLGLGGVLITLGYSAGRKTTIDVSAALSAPATLRRRLRDLQKYVDEIGLQPGHL